MKLDETAEKENYLNRYHDYKQRMKSIYAMLTDLEKESFFSSSTLDENGKVLKSKNIHSFEDKALQKMDYEEELKKDYINCRNRQNEIIQSIFEISAPKCRECIYSIYINRERITEFADKKEVTVRTVHRWKAEGLNLLQIPYHK